MEESDKNKAIKYIASDFYITGEQAQNYLRANFKSYICPMCRGSDWTVYYSGEKIPFIDFLSVSDGDDDTLQMKPGTGSPILLLVTICNDCGFVAQHERTAIMKWIKQNEQK